ncbi:MAG: ABC transporter substrate-binding protein ['Conium maculatum' witches'-broom phytoplasma]|nr:ABC transporter substrate-binding protein ['Conium maculatum' witches'-broom phytoplasma]
MNCKNKKVMIGLMVSLSVLLIFFIIYRLIKNKDDKSKKDYFIISTSTDLNGFDPTDPTHSGHVILNNIHDPFDKMIENEQISIPEGTNKDQNKELIFTLKKGLFFHNGDEVTIDDIKFFIEKGQSKENEKYKKLAIDKIDELNKDKKQYKITFKNNVFADDLKNIRILNQKAIEKEKKN